MESKSLQEIAREQKREYYRKWREKNRDKVKQSNKAYWERKAAKLLAAEREANPQ